MGKSKPIPVRLSSDLNILVVGYASFLGVTKSEAIRELLKEGLLRKAYVGLLKRWQEKIKHRDPIMIMITCDKCGVKDGLKIYHVDKNVRNCNAENLVVLCESCLNRLDRFIQKYNPKEKFAAWFFFTKK